MALPKPPEILGRGPEWNRLVEVWDSPRSELVFMMGRRRVGKSWLLQRFTRSVGGVYFQATRGTRSEQLQRLSGLVGEHLDDPALRHGLGFSDWRALLEYMTERLGGRPFLFVIDEFPYLAEEDASLTSILQLLWDGLWKESARFKLVLCGSHVSLMRQLEDRDQPLHGRRTARLHVTPFTHREVAAFVPSYERRDQLRAYGAFGGLPGHLDQLDPDESLPSNAADLLLDPTSRLFDEATHVLDGFGKDADVPYSVLFAIATGAHTWGELKNRVARSEGAVWPVVEWLQDMDLIEREVPATRDDPARTKISLYRVTDPYLRFWYRFIQPLYTSGAAGLVEPIDLWRSRVEPRLDDYMGSIFEDACRNAIRTGLELPVEPYRVGRWWTRNGSHEVDVVVRGPSDELFAAECKWGRVTHADLSTLRERSRLIAAEIGAVPTIHLGLFSGADDFTDEVAAAADRGEVTLFGPESLFR